MESQSKPGFDGTQGVANRAYNAAAASPRPALLLPGYILRGIAMVLTFISAIVMGVAKEDITWLVQNGDSTTSSYDTSIKSTYSAAYVYFIVANVLVLVYTLISLVISLANRSGSSGIELLLAIADLLMVVLLFSSNGAAIAIDVVAEHGQSKLGWDKFCDAVHKFCSHVKASIVLSMMASVAYVILVILTTVGLHKRTQ